MASNWETTVQVLSGLFAKPKLSEKLLGRPPFRFIHDIVSAVMNSPEAEPGFAQAFFEAHELDAQAIAKDKEAKLQYLDKIISYTAFCLREFMPARPSKIVAGQDAENTNVWLQNLGRAATTPDLDYVGAATMVLRGYRQSPAMEALKEFYGGGAADPVAGADENEAAAREAELDERAEQAARRRRKQVEDQLARDAAAARLDQVTPPEKERPSAPEPDMGGGADAFHARPQSRGRGPVEEKLDADFSSGFFEGGLDEGQSRRPERPSSRRTTERQRPTVEEQRQFEEGGRSGENPETTTSNRPPKPSSGGRPSRSEPIENMDEEDFFEARTGSGSRSEAGSRGDSAGAGRPSSGSRPMSSSRRGGRPMTAGRRPPPVSTNERPTSSNRPVSGTAGRPGSGTGDAPKVTGLITDDKGNSSDEGDDGIIMVDPSSVSSDSRDADSDGPRFGGRGAGTGSSGSVGGSLEGYGGPSEKRKFEGPLIDEEAVRKEIDTIRNGIQKLCATSNPLSKSLEFLQEDIDSMSKELEFWRNESNRQATLLEQQNAQTSNALQPLYNKLHDYEMQIKDQAARIYSTKAQIQRNALSIERFVKLVVLPSTASSS